MDGFTEQEKSGKLKLDLGKYLPRVQRVEIKMCEKQKK